MSQIFTDQIGNQIEKPNSKLRIVSLVPSQTELLFDLGLDKEVIGITKFCVRPQKWLKEKRIIGGTKTLHLDWIEALAPNLIIANKEENTQAQIEELSEKYPVWTSDVQNLEQAISMISAVSKLVEKKKEGETIIKKIEQAFDLLKLNLKAKEKPAQKTAYFIWRNPMMLAGGDTFIHSMMEKAGFENAFAHQNRYPMVTADELKDANLSNILLSSEPFPFKEKHLAEFQKICPSAKIHLVDGEMFSWYGSRLILAAKYFSDMTK